MLSALSVCVCVCVGSDGQVQRWVHRVTDQSPVGGKECVWTGPAQGGAAEMMMMMMMMCRCVGDVG